MKHHEEKTKYLGLNVSKGIERPPTINPYLKSKQQRKDYTADEYVDEILKGNITMLSQAVTLIESSRADHQKMAQAIIEKCLPHAGNSIRVGITGVPGAGKSTSIDSLGVYLAKQGK